MILIVRRDEVADCVRSQAPYLGALDVLEAAFRAYGLPGQVHTSPVERTQIHYPPEGTAEKDLWIMPMYVPPIGCAAMRIGAAGDSVIALYDFENMGIQAVLQDEPLGPLRAGLPLALAAKHLARPGARTLGCIGEGPALDAAIAATTALLQIEDVIRDSKSGVEAAARADVVFLSGAPSGALEAEQLASGQLVATIDCCSLSSRLLAQADLVFASRRHAGIADTSPGAELGEVLRGEAPGRRDGAPVVFASQPDIGFVDVATAWWCFGVAQQRRLGVEVPLAGLQMPNAAAL